MPGIDYRLTPKKRTRGRPIYHCRVLGDRGPDGRKPVVFQRSTGETNKDAAHRVVARWIADGTLVRKAKTDISEYLTTFYNPIRSEYLRERERTERPYSQLYIETTQSIVRRLIIPWFIEHGITDIQRIRAGDIRRWVQDMAEDDGCTPRTANRARQHLNTALRFAVEKGIIASNPVAAVKPQREPQGDRRPFTEADIRTLVAADYPDPRVRAGVLLAIDTGMRLGECRGLLWGDVDVEGSTVVVRHNWTDSDRLHLPKSGKERGPLEITQLTVGALLDIPVAHVRTPGSFVLWGESPTRPIDAKVLPAGLLAVCKREGIDTKGKTFHSLRHAAVSLWGPRMSPADRLLYFGHSDAAVQERYTHRTDSGIEALLRLKESLMAKGA